MDTIITKPQEIIPQVDEHFTVLEIRIRPADKSVVTIMQGDNGTQKEIMADVTTEWTAVTTANKNVIRAFLKKIVAICNNIDIATINGEAL